MRAALFALLTLVAFIGCESKANTFGTSSTNTAKSVKLKADYSSPKASFATFLRGVAAKDLEILSACISSKATSEFAGLRDKSTTAADLDGMAELFAECSVGEAEINPATNEAVVPVKLRTRDERINMVLENGAWRILDF